jgi:hypothetical protein
MAGNTCTAGLLDDNTTIEGEPRCRQHVQCSGARCFGLVHGRRDLLGRAGCNDSEFNSGVRAAFLSASMSAAWVMLPYVALRGMASTRISCRLVLRSAPIATRTGQRTPGLAPTRSGDIATMGTVGVDA